jgi:hypothetical protein
VGTIITMTTGSRRAGRRVREALGRLGRDAGAPQPPGGRRERRRYTWRDAYRDLVPLAALIIAAVAVGGANRAASTADRATTTAQDRAADAVARSRQLVGVVARVERRDAAGQRATAFRLCSRNAIDRAFAQSSVAQRAAGGRGPAVLSRPAAVRAMAAMQDPYVLPVLDCSPNLRGRGAVPYSRAAGRRFVLRYVRRELSAPERGICPGSSIPPRTVRSCTG